MGWGVHTLFVYGVANEQGKCCVQIPPSVEHVLAASQDDSFSFPWLESNAIRYVRLLRLDLKVAKWGYFFHTCAAKVLTIIQMLYFKPVCGKLVHF